MRLSKDEHRLIKQAFLEVFKKGKIFLQKETMNIERQFIEVRELIHQAKSRALKAVNIELINLYWEIGKYISVKVVKSEWGKGIVIPN